MEPDLVSKKVKTLPPLPTLIPGLVYTPDGYAFITIQPKKEH